MAHPVHRLPISTTPPRHAHGSSSRWQRAAIGTLIVGALTATTAAGSGNSHPAAARPAASPTQGSRAAGSTHSTPAVRQSTVPATSVAPTGPRGDRPHGATQATALGADGIPVTALRAYQHAAQLEHPRFPRCGLSWPLLAGIGRVESDHGRFAGAILHRDGVSTPRIIGIPLNGHGTARIPDTDHGRLDGDPTYDHAVGPMQFIPATWARYGADGNNDHRIDPFNIFDAALTAADYLCAASGGTLTTLTGQARAVLTYNHSDAYLALVLQLESLYAHGLVGLTIPTLPAHGAVHPAPRPGIPAADPGAALGAAPSPAPVAQPRSVSRTPRTPTYPPPSATAPRPITSTATGSRAPTTCPSTPTPAPPSSSPATSTSASASASASLQGSPGAEALGAPTGGVTTSAF